MIYGFVTGEADWPGQYWFVDLGSEKNVDAINIFNRTDCCTERLSHYNILAFDSSQGLWKVISNHSGDDTTGVSFFRWPVSLLKTQYVMVAKTDQNYLHLAEVQVMGF
ncbi:MAG TPA: discoidin domain-containing protein [Polyangiaceae bacterium]|nr:discoidin domain-containing protein [Polyangiaceae bacterium]